MMKKVLSLALITLASTSFAAEKNFHCPQPTEIQSTHFTAPSIWVAPAMPHAAKGTVGVGLGGNEVGAFIGAESARIGNKPGWVCVYYSKGGMSVNDYQTTILKHAATIPYLRQYLARINQEFENAEPYLKKYPKTEPLGVIGYQAQEK